MAKRRKAPKKAAVSGSEDEAATEIHEPARRWQGDAEAHEPENEAQSKAQTLIDELEAAGLALLNAFLKSAWQCPSSMLLQCRTRSLLC